MKPDLSVSKKGSARKPKQTLTVNEELAELAKKYFRITRHGSLTGFVQNKILSEIRKDAAKIKASGIKIPDWIFTK